MSTRFAELRLLVDEQQRLQGALQVLGDVPSTAAAAPASAAVRAKPRARKPTPPTRRTRAPRGANREAVLRAVKERQSATSAELATVSRVERNTLSGLLAPLVKDGELQTHSLPTGRSGYALAESRSDETSSTAAVAAENAADDDQAAASTPPSA